MLLCEFDTQSVNHAANSQDIQTNLNFSRPFVTNPRLPHGLRKLDISRNANIRVKSTAQCSSNASAECHHDVSTWSDTALHCAIDDILALAPADLEYLTGEHNRDLLADPNSPASVRVEFQRPFLTPPKVVVFFNLIDIDNRHNFRLKTSATNIDAEGFTLHLESWADTILYGAQVGWIAYPEDSEHIFSTSVNTQDLRPWNQPRATDSKEIKFDGVEFWKVPTVFIALNYIDFDYKTDLRINAYVDGISQTGLVWHLDSWGDTIHYSSGASIIAFN